MFMNSLRGCPGTERGSPPPFWNRPRVLLGVIIAMGKAERAGLWGRRHELYKLLVSWDTQAVIVRASPGNLCPDLLQVR